MEQTGHHSIEPGNLRLLERMRFFSDAVFAIVLTLLVLDVHLPPGIAEANLFRGVLSFVSTTIGEYGVFGNAWRLYCMELIAVGAAQLILFVVIYRDSGRLVGGVSRRVFWHRFIRASSPGAGFAILLTLSLMGFPHLSFYLCWVTIPAILILARVALGPR